MNEFESALDADRPPDGMGACEYCGVILPFEYAVHFQTRELVKCYPGTAQHNPGCVLDEPWPEECPF